MPRKCLFLVSSLCVFLSAQALAAEAPSIRGVQLGMPCDGVTQAELKLGSTVVHMGDIEPFHVFDGTESGYEARMLYSCHSGVVDDQIITMDMPDETTAYIAGQRLEQEFQAEFGQPKLDLISPSVAAFFKRLWLRLALLGVVKGDDSILHSAVWDLGVVDIFIHIIPTKQGAYQIAISQSLKRHLEPKMVTAP